MSHFSSPDGRVHRRTCPCANLAPGLLHRLVQHTGRVHPVVSVHDSTTTRGSAYPHQPIRITRLSLFLQLDNLNILKTASPRNNRPCSTATSVIPSPPFVWNHSHGREQSVPIACQVSKSRLNGSIHGGNRRSTLIQSLGQLHSGRPASPVFNYLRQPVSVKADTASSTAFQSSAWTDSVRPPNLRNHHIRRLNSQVFLRLLQRLLCLAIVVPTAITPASLPGFGVRRLHVKHNPFWTFIPNPQTTVAIRQTLRVPALGVVRQLVRAIRAVHCQIYTIAARLFQAQFPVHQRAFFGYPSTRPASNIPSYSLHTSRPYHGTTLYHASPRWRSANLFKNLYS